MSYIWYKYKYICIHTFSLSHTSIYIVKIVIWMAILLQLKPGRQKKQTCKRPRNNKTVFRNYATNFCVPMRIQNILSTIKCGAWTLLLAKEKRSVRWTNFFLKYTEPSTTLVLLFSFKTPFLKRLLWFDGRFFKPPLCAQLCLPWISKSWSRSRLPPPPFPLQNQQRFRNTFS